MYCQSKKLLIALTTVFIFVSSAPASHPYHVSLAEIEWNQKTENFEVALCVWPADLEKALSRQQDQSVDLDHVENLDQLMTDYVTARFKIRDEDGKLAKVRWIGHELDMKKAWLYFEVKTDKKKTSWTLENRIFFELNEDQSNHVNFVKGKTRTSLAHTTAAAKQLLK